MNRDEKESKLFPTIVWIDVRRKQQQQNYTNKNKRATVCLLQRIKCECDETTIHTLVLEAREKVFYRVRTYTNTMTTKWTGIYVSMCYVLLTNDEYVLQFGATHTHAHTCTAYVRMLSCMKLIQIGSV